MQRGRDRKGVRSPDINGRGGNEAASGSGGNRTVGSLSRVYDPGDAVEPEPLDQSRRAVIAFRRLLRWNVSGNPGRFADEKQIHPLVEGAILRNALPEGATRPPGGDRA